MLARVAEPLLGRVEEGGSIQTQSRVVLTILHVIGLLVDGDRVARAVEEGGNIVASSAMTLEGHT